MFNPFVPFHIKMIQGLRDLKRPYLVSQTNFQAMDHFGEDAKDPILMTDYEDRMLAKIHYHALKDKYRAILNLENKQHREKLESMLGAGSRYRVYAAFVENMAQVEKGLNDKYSSNIRQYVSRHTNWRVGSDKTLYPKLQVIFGELFVILKYSGQEVRFKLDELENY
ncbi:MAG: hypothetical protein ABWZ25_15095 [Chitinophagaceae bacterium]